MLALVSQHKSTFANRKDVHFVVRMVDIPEQSLELADCELVIGLPGNAEAEMALLKRHGITHIVCRNSGGEGASCGTAVMVLMTAVPPELKA